MTHVLLLAAVILVIAAVAIAARWLHLWTDRTAAARDVGAGARAQAHRDAGASVLAAYRQFARPSLLLHPDRAADAMAAGARLGGPVWFGDGEEWPRNASGDPLEFVAQLDFTRVPPLDGFPPQGVVRFFVGTNDLSGANFDAPDRSDVRVLWYAGLQDGGRYESAATLRPGESSPFHDGGVRTGGLALRPELIEDLPDFYSWQVQEQVEREPAEDGTEHQLAVLAETRTFGHRIGGHPTFTQYDFRRRGHYDDLDVVLLGLSSDDSIMWGDVGEAVFLIRQTDLDRRDFSRVAFYWDCH